MRLFRNILLAAATLLAGCGGPRIIPDDELARIFHDLYLVNAYVGNYDVKVDTLNIYEPILARYGYTSRDIQYTIGNFAKRKSASLSLDVVNVAAEVLASEARMYADRIALAGEIERIAVEASARTVRFDSLITVRRVADTARLRIVVDDVRPGSYRLSWGYLLDSLDRNSGVRADAWLEDASGRRTASSSRRLDRRTHGRFETTLTPGPEHRRLVIAAAIYPDDLSAPRITIDSLQVIHLLPPREALELLSRSWYGHGLVDSLLHVALDETDFVAPALDSVRAGGR